MANRVTTQRGGDVGLWVSKPGVNVLTAGPNGMLLDISIPMLQVIQSGVITGMSSGSTRNISIPNLGFSPIVLAGSQRLSLAVTHINATTIEIYAFERPGASGSRDVHYVVTNIG